MKLRILAALAALAVGACGGKTEERPDLDLTCHALVPLSEYPDPGSGPVNCQALQGYEIYLLDNFEPGQASIAWYVNNDRTAESDPPPDTDPVPSTEIPNGGRCVGESPGENPAKVCDTPDVPLGGCTRDLELESHRALHLRTGLLTSNGGQLGRTLPLTCDPNAPACGFRAGPPEIGPCSTSQGSTPPTGGCEGFDLSLWEGVIVWARKGPNSADTIKVRVADKNTDDKGCVCDPYTNQNDASNGCDKFSSFVPLDANFRPYLVPFREMNQGGWGMQSPGLDTAGLFSFGIEFGRGSWDLWLDDIGFYRRKK